MNRLRTTFTLIHRWPAEREGVASTTMPSHLGRCGCQGPHVPEAGGHLFGESVANLARVFATFDDDTLLPYGGLAVAGLLAQRLGVSELVDRHVRLAGAAAANAGAKALTVIGSALDGGNCIDDVAVLQAGATPQLFDAGSVGRSARACAASLRGGASARPGDPRTARTRLGGQPWAPTWTTTSPSTSTSTSWRPTGWPSRAGLSSPTRRLTIIAVPARLVSGAQRLWLRLPTHCPWAYAIRDALAYFAAIPGPADTPPRRPPQPPRPLPQPTVTSARALTAARRRTSQRPSQQQSPASTST